MASLYDDVLELRDQYNTLSKRLEALRQEAAPVKQKSFIRWINESANEYQMQDIEKSIDQVLDAYRSKLVIIPIPGDEQLFEQATGIRVEKLIMQGANKGAVITTHDYSSASNMDTRLEELIAHPVLGIIQAQPVRTEREYAMSQGFYGWPVIKSRHEAQAEHVLHVKKRQAQQTI